MLLHQPRRRLYALPRHGQAGAQPEEEAHSPGAPPDPARPRPAALDSLERAHSGLARRRVQGRFADRVRGCDGRGLAPQGRQSDGCDGRAGRIAGRHAGQRQAGGRQGEQGRARAHRSVGSVIQVSSRSRFTQNPPTPQAGTSSTSTTQSSSRCRWSCRASRSPTTR